VRGIRGIGVVLGARPTLPPAEVVVKYG